MVLKMDQRCAYAAKPFVPDLISQSWIGLSSKASDRLWFRREDKNRVESHLCLSFFPVQCLVRLPKFERPPLIKTVKPLLHFFIVYWLVAAATVAFQLFGCINKSKLLS
jgi:hypothetical protein